MLENNQIKLIQTAVRSAGLRTAEFDGRYRMLLRQYLQPDSTPVTSCKQLNNSQLDDILAICEAHGWRHPEKAEDFYRQKIQQGYEIASYGQQQAIRYLAGDLGITLPQLNEFIKHQTSNEADDVAALAPRQAYSIIEALKAIINRQTGKQFKNIQEIMDYYKGATDGTETNQK